ncbi:hypothetical protein MKK88_00230 [Methylobacterium sp. E-005]|uniref:hypothetical protein n=1 Tax=Methylobacterium sp. E-005 TaxID=2836549 RepID=UPI001FB9229A|nr:hypothetical protein [Methylobacterium sp. E-005]MCJ2084423.1 hypothetical protein [Methylobacterium sp. E-005]
MTVLGRRTCRHRSVEFRAVLKKIEANWSRDRNSDLVLDDVVTDERSLIHDASLKRPS